MHYICQHCMKNQLTAIVIISIINLVVITQGVEMVC